MIKISALECGHLFNHSDIQHLTAECEKHNIQIDIKLHNYFFSKENYLNPSLIKDKDIFLINNFDILLQNPEHLRAIQSLKTIFPNKTVIAFAQELPHYITGSVNNQHLVDHIIGAAHPTRVPALKNYTYFPFPMPSKSIYENQIPNIKKDKQILLSGAFRLPRAQLYYRLLSEPNLNTVLFYTCNRVNATQYEGTDILYPVNFKEKFGNKIVSSTDFTNNDYIKIMSESQLVINFSRQVTPLEGFHCDIHHNMDQIRHKKDFEFMSTRVRECALSKTACISGYDKIYEISGLKEGVHMITYLSYEDLVDKCKLLSADPERCKEIGYNLFNYYKENYTDIHLIKKIKEICLSASRQKTQFL
jgi:hypothetical protein